MAWHAKEVVRSIYDIGDADLAAEFVTQLGHDLQDDACPTEVRVAGPDDPALAGPDRRVASGPIHERADRGCQQPDQAHQADRVRLHPVPELPRPRAALRRHA
jgi:hypothetical protein